MKISTEYLKKIPTPILHGLRQEIGIIINERKARYELSQKHACETRPKAIHDSYFLGKKYRKSNCDSAYFDIIEDDWSMYFYGNYNEEKKYYVYIHYNLATEKMRLTKKGVPTGIDFPFEPFYVGKGTGDRYLSKNRSNQHRALIKKMESIDPKNLTWSQIFKNELTEKEALILEAKLILFFGCKGLIKSNYYFTGKKDGLLVNNEYPVIPDTFLNDVVRV